MNMTLWGKVLGYFLLVLGCFMVFVFLGASVIIVLTPSSPLDKSEGILTFASITFFLFLVSFFILKGFYTADRLLHNMDNQVFESFLTYMDRFFISVLPLFALSFDTSLTSFILILSLFLSPLIKSRDRFGNRMILFTLSACRSDISYSSIPYIGYCIYEDMGSFNSQDEAE